MDSLKSDKVAMIFISQGREFQITGSSVFYWIFSKIFSIDFWYTEIRNWVELLFTTNMLSKTWDARPCWIKEISRSSRPEVFLRKGVLKIWRKLQENTHAEMWFKLILIKLLIQITLRHGCSPVNLLHIFRTPFLKNTPGRLLLDISMVYMV